MSRDEIRRIEHKIFHFTPGRSFSNRLKLKSLAAEGWHVIDQVVTGNEKNVFLRRIVIESVALKASL